MVGIDPDPLCDPLIVIISLFYGRESDKGAFLRFMDQEIKDISQESPAS
jgi:hypothetical protein